MARQSCVGVPVAPRPAKARLWLALFASAATLVFATSCARADAVTDWNAKAEAIHIAKQRLSPAAAAREMAILHVSMFDAVNAVERRYASYKLNLVGENASKEAAAAAAAHAVLVVLHPDQQAKLDADLAVSLAAVAEGEPKSKGIDLGKKAAAGIVALRADDGSNAPESYRPHTSAGAYVPTTMPASLNIGGVTPWVMKTGSQFRPAPPPSLGSPTWTKDVNEIREIGGRTSARRTAEQTDIGRFWFTNGPQTWNPILRQVAASRDLNLVDCARLFALAAMASNDAFIAVFDAKYAFNLWRPVTAIRNADLSENKATPREASWLPLGDTPMHPEYPCAHCISSSAVSTVIQKVVGNDVAEITMTSPSAPGVTRKWTHIQDYSDEVANARIYAGFHYRFSTEVANDMGKRIAELTLATQLGRADTSTPPTR
jgi:PAP2 superfamily